MESSDTQQNTTTSPENPDTTHLPPSSAPEKTNENEPSPTSSNHEDHDDKQEPSNQEPPLTNPTEAPPNQEMERSASSYRIPPSVFERSTSETPMDWSMQSNESLFSIHMGNMSFTNDHYYWRSGDLGPPTSEASTSDQMFSYNSSQQGTGGSTAAADMRSRELGIAEAVMKEVIQESEGQNHPRTTTMPVKNVRNAHRSHESNTSTTSFAFSTMGGETDHQKGDHSERIPSTVGSGQEQAQSQSSQSLTQPVEPQPSIKSEPKTPKATEDAATCKWFSCSCSCC